MAKEDWYKKDVELQWQGMRLSFAVSQDLFSSHAIDAGSRLLLKSLHPGQFPDQGAAFDYGCGYGVLGLSWKKLKPGWTVSLVDRDALAVEFSAWNAERLDLLPGSGVVCSVGLGTESAPLEGFDLILWNVPGKAGASVLTKLAGEVGDVLREHGLAALVIVNPLATQIRSVFEARHDLEVIVDDESSRHTIIHARKVAPCVIPGARIGPFEQGVFDRDPQMFSTPVGSYTLTPVVGLPEYESHRYETTLLLSAMQGLSPSPHSLLVFGCGQGHLPMAAHLKHGTTRFTLIDRDQLALEASTRALIASGIAGDNVRRFARSTIGSPAPDMPPVDTAIVILEDQQRPSVMTALIADLEAISNGTLTVVVGGSSTSVTRFAGIVAKRSNWKQKSRIKRHGAGAAVLTVG